jgi:hypothetical protein
MYGCPLGIEKKAPVTHDTVIESTLVGRYEFALTQNSGGLKSQHLQALLIDIEARSKASSLGVFTGLPVCRRTFHRSSPDQPSALHCRGLFFWHSAATLFPATLSHSVQSVSSESVRLASSRMVARRAGSSTGTFRLSISCDYGHKMDFRPYVTIPNHSNLKAKRA